MEYNEPVEHELVVGRPAVQRPAKQLDQEVLNKRQDRSWLEHHVVVFDAVNRCNQLHIIYQDLGGDAVIISDANKHQDQTCQAFSASVSSGFLLISVETTSFDLVNSLATDDASTRCHGRTIDVQMDSVQVLVAGVADRAVELGLIICVGHQLDQFLRLDTEFGIN